MWVIDHEADIESDFSVFHRVEDPTALDGPRFFRLAFRLAAYAGVMQARVVEAKEAEKGHMAPHAPRSAPSAAPSASAPETVSRVGDDTALAMLKAEGWAEHEKEGVTA